jgi:hypothetical protein
LLALSFIDPWGRPDIATDRQRAELRRCARGRDIRGEGNGGPKVPVNEIAPWVHNCGHWTLDGASISQFEQHIRAIAG